MRNVLNVSKMIYSKKRLLKKDYLIAKSKGANIFLFNDIEFNPESLREDLFFNCTINRIESTWYTWNENQKVIESFSKKYNKFFKIKDYDVTLAIQKAMFWSNQKTGYLYQTLINEFSNNEVYYIEPLININRLKAVFKYLLNYFKSLKRIRRNKLSNVNLNGKFGIHIKNNFQLGFYSNLINEAISREDFVVFVDSTIDVRNFLSKNIYLLDDLNYHEPLPWINPFFLSINELYVLDIISNHWNEMTKYVYMAEQMANSGIKKVLLNEAENGHYGACVCEVFRKFGVKTYNTMNGMKAGESQDAYINFDYWFVWDEQMKEMLISENRIQSDKLIVSGHLLQDRIRTYENNLQLPLNKKDIEGKKVISLFSIKGRTIEKIEAIEFLVNLVSNSNEYFLIIRPYPTEKEEDLIRPDINIKNIYTVKYDNSNLFETLQAQIKISDIAIVFGSTVALNCKFMNVPSITFEKRHKSMIYCVDDYSIFHVTNTSDLYNTILKINKKTNRGNYDSIDVSNLTLDIISNND